MVLVVTGYAKAIDDLLSPYPLLRGGGEGDDFWGQVTQGGARASPALG
jgi:hypothetical protein